MIAVAAVAAAGCPSDDTTCGAGTAAADGLTATNGNETVRYGDFAAGANNDCPIANAPEGVVSVTVFGKQLMPAGTAFVSLCLPRPDLVTNGTSMPLVPHRQPSEADDRVQIVDLQAATSSGCRWTLAVASAPTGTARVDGLCRRGTDPAGFALTLDGTVTVTETCTGQPDRQLVVALDGEVAVVPQ